MSFVSIGPPTVDDSLTILAEIAPSFNASSVADAFQRAFDTGVQNPASNKFRSIAIATSFEATDIDPELAPAQFFGSILGGAIGAQLATATNSVFVGSYNANIDFKFWFQSGARS